MEGAGPAVEAANPDFDESVAAGAMLAGAVAVVDLEVSAELAAALSPPKLNSDVAGLLAVVDSVVVAGLLAPAPKRDGFAASDVAVAVFTESPVEAGVEDTGVPKDNPEPVVAPAVGLKKRPEVAAPVLAGVALSVVADGFENREDVEGCEVAGCVDAGVVPPRLNVGGLLAGVAAGVVLPPPNKEVGFAVACVPDVPDAAPPPNKLEPVVAGAAGVVDVVFASLFASLVPKEKPVLDVPVVPPNGVAAGVAAGVELEDVFPKRPEVAVAGLLPKRGVCCWAPAVAGFCAAPKMVLPVGGGPAGVVEGAAPSVNLFVAGVAAAMAIVSLNPMYT